MSLSVHLVLNVCARVPTTPTSEFVTIYHAPTSHGRGESIPLKNLFWVRSLIMMALVFMLTMEHNCDNTYLTLLIAAFCHLPLTIKPLSRVLMWGTLGDRKVNFKQRTQEKLRVSGQPYHQLCRQCQRRGCGDTGSDFLGECRKQLYETILWRKGRYVYTHAIYGHIPWSIPGWLSLSNEGNLKSLLHQ